MGVRNPNSTNYVHPDEPNLLNLHKAMQYNAAGHPVVRTASSDFGIDVAAGTMDHMSYIHKFGAVPSMATNTTGTIWDVNNTLYPWSAWDTPGVINVDRASASDAGKSIIVLGLDENWVEQSETIVLTNANDNLGVKTWSRVFRAFTADGSTNIGDINIQRGSTTVARISAGFAQTQMAVYTVPEGKTGYLYQIACSAQANADGSGFIFVRHDDMVSFRLAHSFEVSGAGGQYDYRFTFPIQFVEHSDIDVRITTRSNNGRYTAVFDLLLIDNQI